MLLYVCLFRQNPRYWCAPDKRLRISDIMVDISANYIIQGWQAGIFRALFQPASLRISDIMVDISANYIIQGWQAGIFRALFQPASRP
jgi:hypothetical protein